MMFGGTHALARKLLMTDLSFDLSLAAYWIAAVDCFMVKDFLVCMHFAPA